MPPKQNFTKEIVAEAAFEVVREVGLSQLTARSIAERLNASTMPIYSYLKSMDDIINSVQMKALLLLAEFQTHSQSGNPFLDMAVGYVIFAQQEKQLFRFLFFDRPKILSLEQQDSISEYIERQLGRKLPFDQFFGTIDQSSIDTLALKSWFFTHGLAVALMSGVIELMDEKQIATLLHEAGGAFYLWETKNPTSDST